jgi:hypothetical protein
MSMHPTITSALAEQHRRDLHARAEAYRIARAVRSSRSVPPRHAADQARTLPRLITAARRMAARLPLIHVPTAEGAGSES